MIDEVTDRRYARAIEAAQTEKDQLTCRKVDSYLRSGGIEFAAALDQISYKIITAGKLGLLAFAIRTRDSNTVLELISKAVRLD